MSQPSGVACPKPLGWPTNLNKKIHEHRKYCSTIIVSYEEESCFEYVCVKIVKTVHFTSIHRVKTGLFYKSNCGSFIDRWLIYDVMKY